MTETLVTLGGLAAIALIVWWFWLSRPKAVHIAAQQAIQVLVEGGTYQPAVLEVASGRALTLTFVRLDATPCAEKVVFGDLNVTADLPLNTPVPVELPPLQPGNYAFTCQMGMYRGQLIVT